MEQIEPAQITSQPTSTPETVSSETQLPKTRLFLLLIILLILSTVSTAFLGYQNRLLTQKVSQLEQEALPTPSPVTAEADPTANWETFNNTKYSFMVKIPLDWKPDRGYPGGEYTDQQLETLSSNGWTKSGFYFSIQALQVCTTTLDVCFKEHQLVADKQGGPYSTKATTIQKDSYLGSKSIVARSSYSGSDNTVRGTFIVHNGSLWMFEVQSLPPASDAIETEVDQILSTFKFKN